MYPYFFVKRERVFSTVFIPVKNTDFQKNRASSGRSHAPLCLLVVYEKDFLPCAKMQKVISR